ELRQRRLVVERLELRRAAGLVKEDDALGLRREVRTTLSGGRRDGKQVVVHQRAQGRGADAARREPEQLTPRQMEIEFVHCFVMVSSRLRMTLATVVHAASSAASSRLSRPDSPTSMSLTADRRSAANELRRPLSRSRRSPTSLPFGVRVVASRNA